MEAGRRAVDHAEAEEVGLDVDQLFKRGLFDDEFIKAGAALGMVGWRGGYFRDLDAGQFVHILQTYGPLWVGIDNESGQSGHAVVIGGYVSDRDSLKIFNPYNRYEPGTVDIDWATPSQFQKKIHNSRFAVQAWQ